MVLLLVAQFHSRERPLSGKAVDSATEGPEIFIRCKIAAKGTSDWHGLILGGRALDWESLHGLGFGPALDYHMLDSLGVRLPRCEDHSRTRKDRAYAFSSSLSAVEGKDCFEPGDADRGLLTFDGPEPLSLQPGDGVLIPVKREGVDCKMVPCVRLFFLLKVRSRPSQGFGTLELLKGPFLSQRLTRT